MRKHGLLIYLCIIVAFVLGGCAGIHLPFVSSAAPSVSESDAAEPAETVVSETAVPKSDDVPRVVEDNIAPALPEIEGMTYHFEGLSIFVPSEVAADIAFEKVPAQLTGSDGFPGTSYPEHYKIQLPGYRHEPAFHNPQILIWPLKEYLDMDAYNEGIVGENLDALNTLLNAEELELSSNAHEAFAAGLPFLPPWNAAQVFAAQVERFAFGSGEGLRFISMYAQAYNPISNYELFYTYQGVTQDQRYYVSAVLPLGTAILPDTGDPQEVYTEQYLAEYPAYVQEIVASLNAEAPEGFWPNLRTLDAMMASLSID